MAEWSKAHAWKVCIPQKGIVGSNPTPSAILLRSDLSPAKGSGMKKEEFERILAGTGEAVDTGSIETHLHALATERRLPRLAIGVCTVRFEESAPTLRAILTRAADGDNLSDDEATLLFRGLHVLGGARDTAAFQPLLRLLRRSHDDLDYLLGDAITQSLGKILAGTFDGDHGALFELIADRSLGEFVREALFHATTFLTWKRRVEPDRMREFLTRFYEERLADDDDIAWIGWLDAISVLGFRDLAPLVHRAWDEGRIPEGVLKRSDFEKDLRDAEKKPSDPDRLKQGNLGYVEDVLEELEWSDHEEERRPDPLPNGMQAFAGPPVTNPWRDVGRNDPCPCGSGKKAKKCCLPH
jgi:hypothetical protein